MLEKLARKLSCDINEANLPVRAEQIRARLRSYPVMIAGEVLAELLLVGAMWEQISHRLLLSWLAVLLSVHLTEAWYLLRYRAETSGIAECRAWRNRLLTYVVLVGGIWGAAGVLLFVPDDMAYQAVLFSVILGMGAAAVTSNSVFPPSLYLFVVLLVTPVIIHNFWLGDRTHLLLSGMLLLFLLYVLNAGRALIRTFESSLRMNLENSQLVGRLIEQMQRAEAAQQQAEQASRSKSKFLAAASHDLRQPMQALTLFVEVLSNRSHDAESTKLVGQIERSVEVLGNMFGVLLDISKLDAGAVQPQVVPFLIQPLLDSLHEEFLPLAREKGLSFEVPCKCSAQLNSDPQLLERMLRNLISNALRYTEQGGVVLSCKKLESALQLEVSDTGIGIAPEHLPHIFEEYYQVQNRHRDRNQGLGLGLAIVSRLEKLLGCEMSVTSTVGVGSCFSFVVPLDAQARNQGGAR